MARSTSVAKSLPFFGTAESARWPDDERLRRLVEDRGGLGDQRVEVGLVERHRRLLSYRGQRLRQRESPGVEAPFR